VRPELKSPRRPLAPLLAELASDALVLVGCAAVVAAAGLVDLRLGLCVGGLVLLGLSYLVAPRG
jgi:hypothetical protein